MASINGYGQLMADWRSLLSAWQRYAELMAGATEDQDLLAQALKQAETLKGVQDRLRGERQVVTQQINAIMAQGKEAAVRIRALARSKIGPKSEALVQFRVAPIRPRKGRRQAPPVEVPPPATE
jgi:hypothetical protein